MVVRPGLETVSPRNRQEAELEVTEKIERPDGLDMSNGGTYVECMGRRLLRLEMPGRRLRGRQKRSLVEVRKEDVRLAAAKAEDRLSSNNNRHQLI